MIYIIVFILITCKLTNLELRIKRIRRTWDKLLNYINKSKIYIFLKTNHTNKKINTKYSFKILL